jgi:hypothetical protein
MVGLILALIVLLVPFDAFAQAQPHIIVVMGDDALRGHIGEFRTDSVDSFTDGQTSTPNLDSIAQNGVMFDHFITSQVCTPTRATLLGFGHAYMPTNLMGRTQTMDGDAGTTGFQDVLHGVEINPYLKTLVDYADDLGYETVFIGKWHLSRLSWRQKTFYETDTPAALAGSMLEAIGFDRATYSVGNVVKPSYLASEGMSVDNQEKLGHNNFVACTLTAGKDNQDCAAVTSAHSTVYFMNALQSDLTSNTNTKVLYFFWPHAAHAPHNWNQASSCGDPQDDPCDDRVAGSSCSNVTCVYEEFITNLDTEIGDLLADMNDGGGAFCTDTTPANGICDVGGESVLDTIFFTWDNGVPGAPTTPSECESSGGVKQTPFPCGTVGGLLAAGAGVASSPGVPITGHVTALREMADLPKTIEEMMGGTGAGLTTAGTSFMDCLDGTVAVGSCPQTEFVPYVEWSPLGSNHVTWTKGNEPQRIPDCSADAAGGDELEIGGWTYEFNDRYLLHRVFSMDGTCNYTEQLYRTDGDTDRYVVLDATQPIADSGPTASADNFICEDGCAGDWDITEDQDDLDALILLHNHVDRIIDGLGSAPPTFGGVSM